MSEKYTKLRAGEKGSEDQRAPAMKSKYALLHELSKKYNKINDNNNNNKNCTPKF